MPTTLPSPTSVHAFALEQAKDREDSTRRKRIAGEDGVSVSAAPAAGAICKLVHKNGESLVINVEYNQLDALLKVSSIVCALPSS
eukprot:4363728-Pleurochrysis_carterae.AAC.2